MSVQDQPGNGVLRGVATWAARVVGLALIGPAVALVAFVVVLPLLLLPLVLAPVAMVTAAYKLGFVPSLATSLLFFGVRTHLGRGLTAVVTAVAAAVFAISWFLWLSPEPARPLDLGFHWFVAGVAALVSLVATVPRWQAKL